MSEQPGPPAAQQHEGPLGRAEDWLRAGTGHTLAADAVTVAEELKPVLKGHFAGVFALAGEVLGKPELRAIAPAVLELAESAARIAGVAL